MSSILSIFVLGAVGWWCLTILFIIYTFLALDKDYDTPGETHLAWPISMLVLYVIYMQFIAKTDIFNFAVHYPLKIILYVLSYFVVGFIWSFVKWWLYVNTIAEKYQFEKDKFTAEYIPKTAVPKNNRDNEKDKKDEWDFIVRNKDLQKPVVSKYKGKITVWIMYWPVSVVWSLLDDFIKKMVRHIITLFQKFYQSISDSAFKKFEKDTSK